jgi:hypothetical protein
MDPISLGLTAATIGEIGMGTSAAGAAVGAVGSLMAGFGQKKMSNYQAAVSAINANVAQQNADYARNVGEVQAEKSGMTTRAQLGAIRSAQAASGVDIGSGSATRVQESEEEIGAYDQAVIRSDAAKRAYGYEVEKAGDIAQSNMYKVAGSQAALAGEIGAFGNILGGVSSVSSKWMQGKQIGLWGS